MADKGGKKPAPKVEPGTKNWWKLVIPVILVIIMVFSVFSLCVNTEDLPTTGNTSTTKAFGNIGDGLKLLPPGAQYVRYIDLESNTELRNWALDNLNGSLPNAGIFGAQAKKDMLATYPFPYFGFFKQFGDMQVVSLADFGPNFDNKNYSSMVHDSESMRSINELYKFTPDTYPVIHGQTECVAAEKNFLNSNSRYSASQSYSDLFEQVRMYPQTADDARLAVVGNTSTLAFGDRYFAGVTPTNDTWNYKIVVHLNRTLTEEEKTTYQSHFETIATYVSHFDYYQVKFTDKYMIVDAGSNLTTCMKDMRDSWNFLIA
jgi:hypothetical protein